MSTALESSQNHQHKETSGEVGKTPGKIQCKSKISIVDLEKSSRYDDTPREIERAARSIRHMMRWRRDCNNTCCLEERQQNIQLDSEWLDTITETVTDSGLSLHPIEGPPTIYKLPHDIFCDHEAYRPAVVCIGPYHYHHYRGASNTIQHMQDHKWRCVNKLIVRCHRLDRSNATRTLLGKWRFFFFFLYRCHLCSNTFFSSASAPWFQIELNSGLYRRNVGYVNLALILTLSYCKDYECDNFISPWSYFNFHLTNFIIHEQHNLGNASYS